MKHKWHYKPFGAEIRIFPVNYILSRTDALCYQGINDRCATNVQQSTFQESMRRKKTGHLYQWYSLFSDGRVLISRIANSHGPVIPQCHHAANQRTMSYHNRGSLRYELMSSLPQWKRILIPLNRIWAHSVVVILLNMAMYGYQVDYQLRKLIQWIFLKFE